MRIDQKKRQNLPMARLGLVDDFKRRHTMLKDIRECNYSALVAGHASKFLRYVCFIARSGVFGTVDCLDEFVSVLFIGW